NHQRKVTGIPDRAIHTAGLADIDLACGSGRTWIAAEHTQGENQRRYQTRYRTSHNQLLAHGGLFLSLFLRSGDPTWNGPDLHRVRPAHMRRHVASST